MENWHNGIIVKTYTIHEERLIFKIKYNIIYSVKGGNENGRK